MADTSVLRRELRHGMRRLAEGLGRAGRIVLTGDKYEHYLKYHASTGCEHPPLTEAQFWRDYHAWQDDHPEGRCC
ncbi:YbdD/YjiX family protein [Kocuria rosea]|uniref:YbdD/YjiX family protein n=1 Tax=Kocuria rosea TaxID=1275 RepID=UPI003018E315